MKTRLRYQVVLFHFRNRKWHFSRGLQESFDHDVAALCYAKGLVEDTVKYQNITAWKVEVHDRFNNNRVTYEKVQEVPQ